MKRKLKHLAAMLALTGFVLGLHDGRLTLWREGSSHPEQIYDIREDSLPPADRLMLQRGIRIESRQELWEILENYLS
jgi:hypothetical protein